MWRKLIYILFFYICIEGFVSNYLYPWKLPLLFKDFIILGIYISAWSLIFTGKEVIGNGVFVSLIAFGAICFVYIFHPSLPSILVGLIGVRVTRFYIPLMIIGYHFACSTKQLMNFIFFNIVLSIPPSLYAFYQYFRGVKALSLFGRFDVLAIYTGMGESYLRVPSTFAGSGSFAVYLAVVMILAIAFLNARVENIKKVLAILCLILMFPAILISGARSYFSMFALGVLILFVLQKSFRRLLLVFLIFSLLFLVSVNYFGRGIKDRFETINVSNIYNRVYGLLIYPMSHPLRSYFGAGIGNVSSAARHVVDQRISIIESYYLKLTYEVGILGLLIFLWFIIELLIKSYRARAELEDITLKWVGVGIFSFQLALLISIVGTVALDVAPANLFFWFLTGVLFKLPLLQSSEDREIVSTYYENQNIPLLSR